jgi:hypothetical protein
MGGENAFGGEDSGHVKGGMVIQGSGVQDRKADAESFGYEY